MYMIVSHLSHNSLTAVAVEISSVDMLLIIKHSIFLQNSMRQTMRPITYNHKMTEICCLGCWSTNF